MPLEHDHTDYTENSTPTDNGADINQDIVDTEKN
jgi:hypothetical protein